MAMTREEVLALVREFRDHLVGVYGDRLKGVYLYGSHARGEATEDSDIDVAVVLGGPLNPYVESERTSEVFGELSLRNGCLLVPFFMTEQDYRTQQCAVHRSIVQEGVGV